MAHTIDVRLLSSETKRKQRIAILPTQFSSDIGTTADANVDLGVIPASGRQPNIDTGLASDMEISKLLDLVRRNKEARHLNDAKIR